MEQDYAKHIARAEKVTENELYVQIETNSGQPALRGIYKAELVKRQNTRQDNMLREQLRTSKLAADAAFWSAIATGLAAAATLGQLLVAIFGKN